MPAIYEVARQFRRELLAQEQSAAARMITAYGTAWQRLQGEINALNQRIRAARLAGETVNAGWLYRKGRIESLLEQVAVEIARFAGSAEGIISIEQARLVAEAQQHMRQMVLAGVGEGPGVVAGFNVVPTRSLEKLVGFLGDGSPLKSLLDELGSDAAKAVEAALLEGLATGQGARAIARTIRGALGGNLTRALTIARTETIRAYRESTWESLQANANVLEGWVWLSAANRRTCAACWAMHGTVHKLSEKMESHPNCRCSMMPKTKSWSALGFPGVAEAVEDVELGNILFDALSSKDRLFILGPAKFRAYEAGEITLQDLLGRQRSRRWGVTRYERSLKAALAAAALRRTG